MADYFLILIFGSQFWNQRSSKENILFVKYNTKSLTWLVQVAVCIKESMENYKIAQKNKMRYTRSSQDVKILKVQKCHISARLRTSNSLVKNWARWYRH